MKFNLIKLLVNNLNNFASQSIQELNKHCQEQKRLVESATELKIKNLENDCEVFRSKWMNAEQGLLQSKENYMKRINELEAQLQNLQIDLEKEKRFSKCL